MECNCAEIVSSIALYALGGVEAGKTANDAVEALLALIGSIEEVARLTLSASRRRSAEDAAGQGSSAHGASIVAVEIVPTSAGETNC